MAALTSDVATLIASSASAYDAILLDVDNGPEGLTRAANDRLYNIEGLAAAAKALRPGGVLGVWSSGPSDDFPKRLRSAGFGVEAFNVRAKGARGRRQVVWLAAKAGVARQR